MASTITSAQVEAAIADILSNGQRVTIGDRTFEAGDLSDLQKLLQETAAAERSQSTGMFTRATFGKVR